MPRSGVHEVDCYRDDDRTCGGGRDWLLSVSAVAAGGDSEPITKNLTSIVIKNKDFIFLSRIFIIRKT